MVTFANGIGDTNTWLLTAGAILLTYVVSTLIYRLYFHPAARFSGPKFAAVSYLEFCYQQIRGRFPWYVDGLLRKYGKVVRIGPNEIAFFTPEAALDIYGSAVKNQETFVKTDLMDYGLGDLGFIWETDPAKRKAVGKKILPAFGAKANRGKEPIMHEYIDLFISQMGELGGGPDGLKMNDWVLWLGVDMAADLAYSRQLHHLRDGKTSNFVDMLSGTSFPGTLFQLNKKMPGIALLAPLFVPFSVLRAIPSVLKSNSAEVKARIEKIGKTKHADYMDYMLSPEHPPPATAKELLHVEQVAVQMFIAGFDPIQIVFYAAIYFLVQSPEVLANVTTEIRNSFASYPDITFEAITHLQYLDAFLHETLRTHLITASGLPRISPGAMVDGTYVPKGVVCYLNTLTAMRHEDYFQDPMKFRPQRWLPANHPLYEARYAHDNLKAFFPFSIGPRQCTGREIAMLQTKLFLGKLLWCFDLEGVSGHRGTFDSDFSAHVMWNKPELYVRFLPAKRRAGPGGRRGTRRS